MARRAPPPRRDDPAPDRPAIRLDRWLFHARVFKSRSLAADRIAAGGIRINGAPCRKPGHEVRPGDVVTAAVTGGVRSLRVVAPGERRGPATEAQTLYEDLDAPAPAAGAAATGGPGPLEPDPAKV